MKKTILLLTLSIFVSGCSIYRINSEEVTSNYYPSKKPEQVQVLEETSDSYEIVGFVTINSERNQNFEEIVEKIKKEAAVLGGDAIINITTNATGTWKKLPAQKFVGNAYVRANYSATVIVFK
ncbi:MAG: hypothetical protein KAR05_02840 [Candidatus Omnitrophica bacterium]|nr:hypothetical protein [Candidatus Omnitrophota bacterium]